MLNNSRFSYIGILFFFSYSPASVLCCPSHNCCCENIRFQNTHIDVFLNNIFLLENFHILCIHIVDAAATTSSSKTLTNEKKKLI